MKYIFALILIFIMFGVIKRVRNNNKYVQVTVLPDEQQDEYEYQDDQVAN